MSPASTPVVGQLKTEAKRLTQPAQTSTPFSSLPPSFQNLIMSINSMPTAEHLTYPWSTPAWQGNHLNTTRSRTFSKSVVTTIQLPR